MQAVVLGYYGFGNVGDESVLWAMRQHLQEVLPGLRLCVLSADPEATAALHGTESVPRTDLKRVRRAMRESTVILSGGGSLFQDATSWRSPLYYGWLHELAARARRPLVVYAQGVGPLRRGLSRWATRRAMQHAVRLTVRDALSARLLAGLGVRAPVEVVCDPVLGLPSPEPVDRSPWIGISLRPWPGVSLDPLGEATVRMRERAGVPEVVADGIGVVWASRRVGCPLPERVPGIELMEALCARAEAEGWAVFLLGGLPGVAEQAALALSRRWPRLRVAGTHHGYFSEDGPVVEQVARSGAQVLFCGLGSPRQELWLARNLARLGVQLAMGVGGSLDVLAGRTPRAPLWLRRLHLEWLYRLLREPRRWRRQLALPRFAWLVLRSRPGREGAG
jgi:N-acetylglucosaminyldiphosphoundecaprenol N-acetyl-beta-D-mannosaminyltransferase